MMKKNSPLNLRLDDDQRAWVKRYAHLLNWSENQVVRDALSFMRQTIENPDSSEMPRLIKFARAAEQNRTNHANV